MCQVTSNPYSDPRAIKLSDDDFRTGSLRVESFARPGKLFTANSGLIARQVGVLDDASFDHIIDVLVRMLRGNLDG